MKIPNSEAAVVDIQKLRDYSLSLEHPRGRHKARVFAAALGVTAEDSEDLQNILLNVVQSNANAVATELDEHGQRYLLDFMMSWNDKQAEVRSTWIIRADENFPRLTSCYVL